MCSSDLQVISEKNTTKRKMVSRSGLIEVTIDKRYTPSLRRDLVYQLANLGMDIETFYGTPQDIEWAYAENQFHILQARTVTTLTDTVQIEILRRREIEALEQKSDPYGTVWSRYNLAEVLPAPLPMTWSIQFPAPAQPVYHAHYHLGLPTPRTRGPPKCGVRAVMDEGPTHP